MYVQIVLLTYAAEQLTIHYEESKSFLNGSCTVCSKQTVQRQVLERYLYYVP